MSVVSVVVVVVVLMVQEGPDSDGWEEEEEEEEDDDVAVIGFSVGSGCASPSPSSISSSPCRSCSSPSDVVVCAGAR